jgi:hypothetical protein
MDPLIKQIYDGVKRGQLRIDHGPVWRLAKRTAKRIVGDVRGSIIADRIYSTILETAVGALEYEGDWYDLNNMSQHWIVEWAIQEAMMYPSLK